MPRQFAIHVDIVAVDEIDQAAVVGQQALHERSWLFHHRRAQRLVITPHQLGIRPQTGGQVVGAQPLAHELFAQHARLRIGEHALDLYGDAGLLLQRAILGGGEQRGIGHGRPEEIRQAVGQFVEPDLVGILDRLGLFDAEDEVGRGQDRGIGQAQTVVMGDVVLLGRAFVDAVELGDICAGHRPAPSIGQEVGERGLDRLLSGGDGDFALLVLFRGDQAQSLGFGLLNHAERHVEQTFHHRR